VPQLALPEMFVSRALVTLRKAPPAFFSVRAFGGFGVGVCVKNKTYTWLGETYFREFGGLKPILENLGVGACVRMHPCCTPRGDCALVPLSETPQSIKEQLLYRNVQRFRGGLVIKAHRRLYHSTLGLRVKKKKDAAHPSLCARVWCLVFGVWCLVFGVWCLVFGVWCLVFGVWC